MKAQNINMTQVVKKNKLVLTINIKLTGVKWYQFKMTLAGWLMRIAGYLVGAQVKQKNEG